MKNQLSRDAQFALKDIGLHFAECKTGRRYDMERALHESIVFNWLTALAAIGTISIRLWWETLPRTLGICLVIVLVSLCVWLLKRFARPEQLLVGHWKKVRKIILKFGPKPLERTTSIVTRAENMPVFSTWISSVRDQIDDVIDEYPRDAPPEKIAELRTMLGRLNELQDEFYPPPEST